jgi:hypothetical protein
LEVVGLKEIPDVKTQTWRFTRYRVEAGRQGIWEDTSSMSEVRSVKDTTLPSGSGSLRMEVATTTPDVPSLSPTAARLLLRLIDQATDRAMKEVA